MDEENLTTEQMDKLIHFQEVTHIDSIEECRHLLEAHDWNIELAVSSTFNDQFGVQQQEQQQQFNHEPEANLAPLIPQMQPQQLPTNNSQNNLPAINIFTQRSLSYYNQPIVPKGIFQWSYFIIAFPIRFLYVTLTDIFGFFWKLFEKNGDNDVSQQNYDPFANIVEFIVEFNQTYGAENHPNFFEGSYGQAVAQAKKDFKFLLVYLHDKDNADCNKFCTETLSNRDVIEYLNNQVLLWACSKHLPEGKKVHNALKAKRCPFLGLIVLRQNKMTLVSRIEGPIAAGELIVQLSQMLNDYQGDLTIARIEKEHYSQSQRLREQQDQAYAECLKQDQEKARKQRELEEEKKRIEEEERKMLEDEKLKEEEILNLKIELKKQMPKEADASNANAIKLLLKLPSGRRLERVFLKTDPAKYLHNFLFCDDECPRNFEIVTNFPRKKIECTQDCEQTLNECGINQSMLLFVNDLDA